MPECCLYANAGCRQLIAYLTRDQQNSTWERTVHLFTATVHVHAVFVVIITLTAVGGGLAVTVGLFMRPIALIVFIFIIRETFLRGAHSYF